MHIAGSTEAPDPHRAEPLVTDPAVRWTAEHAHQRQRASRAKVMSRFGIAAAVLEDSPSLRLVALVEEMRREMGLT